MCSANTGFKQEDTQPLKQHLVSPVQSASDWHSWTQFPSLTVNLGHSPALFAMRT